MPERRPLRPRHLVRPNGAEQIDVPSYAARMRLDAFLVRYSDDRSRSEWQRLIQAGAVTLDGRQVRPSDRVAAGQRVQIAPGRHVIPDRPRPTAEISLTIVYQDPAMLVVNKPPGLVVHPAPGHEEGTLVNALLAIFPDLADPSGEQRPGIVHRLDKDTSGLIVVGRTTAAMAALQAQFKERTAEKRYLLLVQGDVPEEEAAIEVPIGRDQRDRTRMSARSGGREARTQFTVLERYGDYTLVEADLQSGRTHQLRVHFQFIGHPVAGDRTYGNVRGPSGLRRQFVHASYMRIRSPFDDTEHEFYSPLPADLRSPLERLRAAHGLAPETLPAAVLGGPSSPGAPGAAGARQRQTQAPMSAPAPGARPAASGGGPTGDGMLPVAARVTAGRRPRTRPSGARPTSARPASARPRRGPRR
jgi:23S rRNA pseudouridine1911/1915/1917 synthase